MKIYFWALSCCTIWVPNTLLYAATANVALKSELNLEPACLINQSPVLDQSNMGSLGQFDFGTVPANFRTVSAGLTNTYQNAIRIHCPLGSDVQVQFSAGLHASHVPQQFSASYQRAMSNGLGDYVAYQIYEGTVQGKVLSPDASLDFKGGVEAVVHLYAEAVNAESLFKGEYRDQITVTVNF